MAEYRERLWPAPWILVATALVIPASLLVLAPLSMLVGAVTGIVLYAGCVGLFVYGAPILAVRDGKLSAGRATIGVNLVGDVVPFDGEEASLERGQRLNARAFLILRGGIRGVVKVQILDPNDPTPYWLLSTRRPTELAAAIVRSQRPDVPVEN
ncbi:DUF3093 domain-containing protein [Mycetocola zhadangensis]|uniref:DUF3093 domain-containing protein n=1 Tax=Mycetocola zhadangensis TaxID=1164595 RepID=A0A3L7J6S4_9MICO|nr:DUF3093 domain-containing protein [Mycetocola zhadangensis]RLQ86065.1 DUF3093 domain-containing protein [Mycetocola zhadangensis]GGE88085.1 membrane protein [Mycetocola zhadangensis]